MLFIGEKVNTGFKKIKQAVGVDFHKIVKIPADFFCRSGKRMNRKLSPFRKTLGEKRRLKLSGKFKLLVYTLLFGQVGIDLNDMPPELRDAMNACDLIIAKGMANYEAFSDSDFRPIAYMMKTKCRPVADSIGLPEGISAAKLVE
jgi:hypothetical protein